MAKSTVELQMLTNAKQMLGELQQINGSINAINYSVQDMNRKGVAGAKKHGSAIKSLALRFVGYNLILNQVMGAQQKLIDYTRESVQKFREFETRLAEVSTIMTGDYEPALLAMKSGIEGLALATGQATSDLTKGLYDIMSAAFDAKDAMNLLNTATKASIAGLSDVRTSVDIFTTVLNTYGMSVYEATKVSDTLFQSVVRGKFQFADLESALGYVVPIAAQAGIEFEELMAALSTTTRHGLHLDMAARGLAMGLQGIINPSEGASKAAKKYGVELSGLALRIKGISGVFGEMAEASKKYGKIVLNELIPNIRSLRVAMVLAGDEGLEGLLDDMDRLSVSAGRTEEAFNKIKNTSQFASNQIQQDWEQTQREVGKAWDELALGLQRGVTDFVDTFANVKSLIPGIGLAWNIIESHIDEATQSAEKFNLMHKYAGQTYIPEPLIEAFGRETLIGQRLDYDVKKLRKQHPDARWIEEETLAQFEAGKPYMKKEEYEKKLAEKRSEAITDYLGLQKEILKQAEEVNLAYMRGDEDLEDMMGTLDNMQVVSALIQDNFNRAFGEPILGGIRNLESLQLKLDEIEFNTEKLEEHLEKPLKYGWGEMGGTVEGTLNMQMKQLKADQDLADTKHDVKMGLVDESYQFKVLNDDMQEAVRIVREHDEAVKTDTETINKMNIALRLVNIEMLKLQLVGMSKRRGLSRSEQKRMKALQIQAAKLRLENMENTKAETVSQYVAYEQAKELIDKTIADKEHETYMLEYNYDQQIADLDETILYEEGLLKDRADNWRNTTDDIIIQADKLIKKISELTPEQITSIEELFGIDVAAMKESATGMKGSAEASLTAKDNAILTLEQALAMPGMGGRGASHMEWMLKKLKSYERGISYVPETGLALLHRGESVGAAGSETGGGVVIENLTISVKEIAELGSAEKLAALLAVAKNSQILNKAGKSNYRMR